MDFRNRTKEIFDWDTQDDLGVLIEQDPGSHPDLAADFRQVILEEDTPIPIAAVETKTFFRNAIAAAASATSGIKNTTGFYYDRDSPTPIFKINPIP